MQILSTIAQLPETMYNCQLSYAVEGPQVLRCAWDAVVAWLSTNFGADMILLIVFCVGFWLFRFGGIHCLMWSFIRSTENHGEVVSKTLLEVEGPDVCRKHSCLQTSPKSKKATHKSKDGEGYGPRPRCPALRAQNAGQPLDLPEACTTVVLKNLPKSVTPDALLATLHECGYFGEIDFVYIPLDFKQGDRSVGMAILNFRNIAARLQFASEFHHMVDGCEKLFETKTSRLFEVSPAGVQGSTENIQRLQKSSVLSWLARYPMWLPRVVDGGGLAMPLKAMRRNSRARYGQDAAQDAA